VSRKVKKKCETAKFRAAEETTGNQENSWWKGLPTFGEPMGDQMVFKFASYIREMNTKMNTNRVH